MKSFILIFIIIAAAATLVNGAEIREIEFTARPNRLPAAVG